MFKAAIKDQLRVPAHIDYLGELRNFVTKTGKKHGFSDSVVNAFKLSIDEAATNIIKHAYRDTTGEITIRIVVKRNSMTVILIDQGRFFDPTNVKDPDLKRYVDIGKKGGLGIFMIRKLCDEIDYRHTEEGNELRLTKFKDGAFRKKEDVMPESAVSAITISLKAKYSLIAASILTAIVVIGFFYNYISSNKKLIAEQLSLKRSFSEGISSVVLNPEDNALSTFYISENYDKVVNLKDYPEILRVLILDNNNICMFPSDQDEDLFYTEYIIPEERKTIAEGIYKYKINKFNMEVYDIVSNIYSFDETKKGETHLQIRSEYIDNIVAGEHYKNLRNALLILALGYVGIVIMVYLILNPFNKLAQWIKDLGHGEVEDEIDFDTSNEVGEIAKAFSEITDKFRQSQANLAEQERLQKEMQLAQDIQQTLLPPFVPEIEGYEISSMYQAAKEVGGDYYDFVEVDKDSLGIVVADVSGKGVPGSLIMTMIRTALRTEARGVKSASEVLARLNQFVVKDMKKGMFVTIFYVIIDSKRRRLNYASAGHNPMILFRPTTNKTYYLNPKGFPVGISLPDQELFKKSIESDTIQLAEDDVLLIYTDGITEAMNHKRNLFGEERLLDAIRKYSNLRVQPFVDNLKEDIEAFTQGFEQSDDITLVAIKEKSSPEKIELNRAQHAHRLILDGKSIREACEKAGITTYAYYNKYKKVFEEEGMHAYSLDDTVSLEAKHLSIEEKTKIYDVIKKHPEFGAKRISEELNTERYDYTEINESRVYDELVRSRLNTRQLREAYVTRSGKKKRMKPPGTPMLTLDGRIILDKEKYEFEEEEQQIEEAKTDTIAPKDNKKKTEPPKEFDDDFYIESLVTVPIEELLKKNPDHSSNNDDDYNTIKHEFDEKESDITSELESDEKELDELMSNYEEAEENVEDDDLFSETLSDVDFNESEVAPVTEKNAKEEESNVDDFGIDEDYSFKDVWNEQISETENYESRNSDPGDVEQYIAEDNELDNTDDQEDDSWDNFDESQEMDIINVSEDDEKHDLDFENEYSEDHVSTKGEIGDVESIFDDEISFENLLETEQIKASNLYEDKGGNGNMHDEENNEDVDREFENTENHQFEYKDDDLQIEDENLDAEMEFDDSISFHDLLKEIEEDVSFLDSGIDIPDDIDDNDMDFVDDSDLAFEDDEVQHEDNILENNNDSSFEQYNINEILKNENLILGLKFYKQKQYDNAITEFQQVVKVYPNFKEIHSMLGNAYFRNDNIKNAMLAYERVKEIDPSDVDAYENIGVIYANRGEYTKAITEWRRILEIDPTRTDIKKNVERAITILEKDNIKV